MPCGTPEITSDPDDLDPFATIHIISGVVVSQCPPRPETVISSTVFDLDIVFSAITTTFLTAVDQSNTFMQIARLGRFGLIAVMLLVTTLRFAIGLHGDCLIRRVK